MQSQLRGAGLVLLKDHRLLMKLIYSELSQGKWFQGDPEKCFKDTLNVSMKSFGIAPNCLEYLTHDRDMWREVVKRGAQVCETRRKAAAEHRRKLRNGVATSATAATIHCSLCPRLFRAQIDLISHLHVHGCLLQSKSWSGCLLRLRRTKKTHVTEILISMSFSMSFSCAIFQWTKSQKL